MPAENSKPAPFVQETAIAGVLIITPKRHGDERGFFSETYNKAALADYGVRDEWVQDNHSRSTKRGTLRGLHFQAPPHGQAKLIRVTCGAIFDVAVDIRKGSPTYGKHVAVELSDSNWRQLYVPEGFAHGFCTLTDACEVQYKVSAPYAAAAEGGLDWADPMLAIGWPLPLDAMTANARDKSWPKLSDFKSPF